MEVNSDKSDSVDFIIIVVSLNGLLKIVCKLFGDRFLLVFVFWIVSFIFMRVRIIERSFMV